MSLATSLQAILDSVDDAEAVALIGFDGIVVDEVKRSPTVDMAALAAEYGNLWREMERASDALSFGPVGECAIASATHTLLFRRVSADYCLVMVMVHDGNVGKGRFFLRYSTSTIAREL